jgi:two-component system copper resistance phosphate regulon response regulator CusR
MKILLVEDQTKLASYITKSLEEHGHDIEQAFDGYTGRRLALNNTYDLIILDIVLPEVNGIQICKELRKNNIKIPVLMLTALGTIDDKVTGFEAGADDYLVKPFELRELLARINALFKRNQYITNIGNILSIADLEMNLDNKTVKRGDKFIDLTAKEFALLEYFLKNKGKTISRAEIAEKVWDISFDSGTNVIEVYVNFLRKKIDKDFEPKLIHTQVGMGYALK